MSAEKRSISAPSDLYAKADARKEELGYSTFSDYIQALIRADVVKAGGHLREASPKYEITPSAKAAGKELMEAIADDLGVPEPTGPLRPASGPKRPARGRRRARPSTGQSASKPST
jgi:hypothetical protein